MCPQKHKVPASRVRAEISDIWVLKERSCLHYCLLALLSRQARLVCTYKWTNYTKVYDCISSFCSKTNPRVHGLSNLLARSIMCFSIVHSGPCCDLTISSFLPTSLLSYIYFFFFYIAIVSADGKKLPDLSASLSAKIFLFFPPKLMGPSWNRLILCQEFHYDCFFWNIAPLSFSLPSL